MIPQLSLVIVNYRSEDALAHCLRSIHVATSESIEVIVVDNSPIGPEYRPADGRSAGVVLKDSGLRGLYFPQRDNVGYTKAANFGARHAHGRSLCFLNPDTVLGQHALDRLLDWVERHPRTVAGPREFDSPGRIVTTCFPFVTRRFLWGANLLYKFPWPRPWHPFVSWLVPPFRYARQCRTTNLPNQVPVMSGSCLMMFMSVWQEVGEWHEGLTYFGLESEWFERARQFGVAGWYIPSATIDHEHALSIRRSAGWRIREEADRNRRWYGRRFGWLTLAILLVILWLEERFRPRVKHPTP
ncbi:MAG: glycosyltransferase family 2 protein [Candidatus Kerfeldbacteria bacterium]|nr:glycosyltransferase family 2 protein [Candidatus Kerfeldbacteria bacterium]